MVISKQTPSMAEGQRCGYCRHCVDVRGKRQIVCLAYLAILHQDKGAACKEFERKKTVALASD